MAILVGKLKDFLAQIPNDWLVGAYEGEGTGLVIKAPDYDFSNPKAKWIETGAPS